MREKELMPTEFGSGTQPAYSESSGAPQPAQPSHSDNSGVHQSGEPNATATQALNDTGAAGGAFQPALPQSNGAVQPVVDSGTTQRKYTFERAWRLRCSEIHASNNQK